MKYSIKYLSRSPGTKAPETVKHFCRLRAKTFNNHQRTEMDILISVSKYPEKCVKTWHPLSFKTNASLKNLTMKKYVVNFHLYKKVVLKVLNQN